MSTVAKHAKPRIHIVARLGLFIGLLLLTGCASATYGDQPPAPGRTPSELSFEYQKIYLDLVARAYEADPALDLEAALGPGWTQEELDVLIREMLGENQLDGSRTARLQNLARALDTLPLPSRDAGDSGGEERASIFSRLRSCLLALLLMLLAAVAVYLLIGRVRARTLPAPQSATSQYRRVVEPTTWAGEPEKPLLQFTTTYTMKDQLYDPSISIETESGEFLGECGVGINQTLGTQKTKRVTAFEVWLFDKNDIRTASQILVGENHDLAQDALSSQSTPIVARPGQTFSIETSTLRVRARILDSVCRQDGTHRDSIFDKLVLELAVWPIGRESKNKSWGWSNTNV